MISFEIYKVLHVVMVILTLVCAAPLYFNKEDQPKYLKIINGIASFFIFVAGMGLLARLGVSHGEGWPLWVKVKVAMWVILAAAGPLLNKRLVNNRRLAFFGLLVPVFIAIVSAVYKY